jgi:hypothetical protein
MSKLSDLLKLPDLAANPASPANYAVPISSFSKISNGANMKSQTSVSFDSDRHASPVPRSTQDSRAQQVLTLLRDRPGTKRTFIASPTPDGGGLVTLAIRDIGTCDVAIPPGAYDGAAIIRMFRDLEADSDG